MLLDLGISNAIICEIFEPACISYKDVILEKMKLKFFSRIGRPNKIIQIDETAICRSKIITNFTLTQDTVARTTWLVGGIEKKAMIAFLKFFLTARLM